MQATQPSNDYARMRGLALARAAQLRSQALDDAWTALGRCGLRLVRAVTRGGRARQVRIG